MCVWRNVAAAARSPCPFPGARALACARRARATEPAIQKELGPLRVDRRLSAVRELSRRGRRRNRAEFTRTAVEWTKRHAIGGGGGGGAGSRSARAPKRQREATEAAAVADTAEGEAEPTGGAAGEAVPPERRGGSATESVPRSPPAGPESQVKGTLIWRREMRTTWR